MWPTIFKLYYLQHLQPPVLSHRLPHMAELAEELERLGLWGYLDVLIAEGFDTWETVLDITESDL